MPGLQNSAKGATLRLDIQFANKGKGIEMGAGRGCNFTSSLKMNEIASIQRSMQDYRHISTDLPWGGTRAWILIFSAQAIRKKADEACVEDRHLQPAGV